MCCTTPEIPMPSNLKHRRTITSPAAAEIVDSDLANCSKRRRHSWNGFDFNKAILQPTNYPVDDTDTYFGKARKAGIALAGGTMVGVGLVMIPLPTPFGAVVAGAGLSVLGTEFPAAQRILDNGKEQLNKALKSEEFATAQRSAQQFYNTTKCVVGETLETLEIFSTYPPSKTAVVEEIEVSEEEYDNSWSNADDNSMIEVSSSDDETLDDDIAVSQAGSSTPLAEAEAMKNAEDEDFEAFKKRKWTIKDIPSFTFKFDLGDTSGLGSFV